MRSILLGFGLLLTLHVAFADSTFVSGSVSGRWTEAHSPYLVEGDISVQFRDTLVIEPGVRVYFVGPYVLRLDSLSELVAEGAEGDSIVFTTDTLSNPTGWRGFDNHFCQAFALVYCVVENVRLNQRSAIDVGYSAHQIEHCAFRDIRGFQDQQAEGASIAFVNSGGAVSNCVFERNRGTLGGALKILWSESTTIENCVFRSNSAIRGGAVFVGSSNYVEFSDCLFEDNDALADAENGGVGGAIWVDGALRLSDCTFSNNRADLNGGAVAFDRGGYEYIRGCLFQFNHADSAGGAIWFNERSGELTRTVFRDNFANRGGAVFANSEIARITHCVFAYNESRAGLSALDYFMLLPPVVNSIFAYNSGRPAIPRPQFEISDTTARNCLFFQNSAGNFGLFTACLGENSEINANGDSVDCAGNLTMDPLFANAHNGNFRLQSDSPCIDAGFVSEPYHTTNDPDNTAPDIGAFFFDQTSASEERPELPNEISLSQNYPNPFNAETTIEFEVPMETRTTLELFDITGRHVRTLFDDVANGRNSVHVSTSGLASGIYIYRLNASGYALSHKMLLIK